MLDDMSRTHDFWFPFCFVYGVVSLHKFFIINEIDAFNDNFISACLLHHSATSLSFDSQHVFSNKFEQKN
ncbi:hypothetical protein AFLA_005832 [Aspergillus flavus NRRL3357]|nr:hypothetical protein AFLA_005832 [Aspergillus flavus NRRL3357]